MSKIIEAICNSQRLESAGPPVVGISKGEQFTLTGVLRQGAQADGRVLVGVSASDRGRLKSAVSVSKSQQLKRWTKQERRQYSSFYVPIAWFDTVYVMSRA